MSFDNRKNPVEFQDHRSKISHRSGFSDTLLLRDNAMLLGRAS